MTNNYLIDKLIEVAEKINDFGVKLREWCAFYIEGAAYVIQSFCDTLYYWVATSVEYHRMKYSKKRRTRKKWRGILHRRLMALLAELREEE